MTKNRGLVMYGGTFDPVHFGHIRSAIEVGETFNVKTIKLVPSFIPPHRPQPETMTEHRLNMLGLAVKNIPALEVDTREIERAGTSYTIETLKTYRDELDEQDPLYLVIGQDAFLLLHEWYEWQSLTELAHLVIIERPGYENLVPERAVQYWFDSKLVNDFHDMKASAGGAVCRIRLRQMDISATMIRKAFLEKRPVDGLLPEAVIEYIKQNNLYQAL